MNQRIDIDTEKLNNAIIKQKNVNKKIFELFEKIKTNNNELKEFWSTRTSSSVFEDFDNVYKLFEKINICNDNYTSFLENVVSSNYIAVDNNISDVIDRKIDVK